MTPYVVAFSELILDVGGVMSRSAMGKLSEADELNRTAIRIRKRDPESARQLDDLARARRKGAIKQMKRHPKRRRASTQVL